MNARAIRTVVLSATATIPLLLGLPTESAAQPLLVVSAGDSYASGEGAIGSGWVNPFCHQSSLAGPRQAAGHLNNLRSTNFTPLACSGSVTGSTTGLGDVLPSGPLTLLGPGGQLATVAALGPVDALTLSIGGNDLGFADIVLQCMHPGFNCDFLAPLVSARLASLALRLDEVAAAMPANVKHVFVTEYPDPTRGPFEQRCGSPLTPGFEGLEGVSLVDAEFAATAIVEPLNTLLAQMVDRANQVPGDHPTWHFVGEISSRFRGHGYCTGGGSPAPWTWFIPRYISTVLDSLTSQGDERGTLHPNELGHQEIGQELFRAMRFLAGPPPPPPPPPPCPGDKRCCEPRPDGSCDLCIPANASCP